MHSVNVKDLNLSFGSIDVLQNLNIDINDGEFLVLLGSSGCGKSTLLNCIAGLLDITDGQVFIKGRNVTWDEPSKRGIGMVFQSYALYPQMSVEGNLSFGLKNAKMPAAEIAKRVNRAAEILQIGPLLKRKPAALSGGQRQRVAIGRALVRDVDVFLFDEPLSNLDAKLRADLRVELKQLHRQLKNTMIYVTHDQVEAMTLADRIAIMRDGAIQQLDSPGEIYNRPVNRYVADFIGSPAMNFLDGKVGSKGLTIGDATLPVKSYNAQGKLPNGKVIVGVRPEHVATGNDVADAAYRTKVRADLLEPMGADTLVWTKFAGHELRFRMDGQVRLSEGQDLEIGLSAESLHLFDSTTEDRL
ncbi:MAG: ABC transporter ATP-binding protein [Pseudomonadota bacterium]|nr:ABC transporter ATP-binding protein [Pseudomonadota bacterium]